MKLDHEEWLARMADSSAPCYTCTATERKFLDEIHAKGKYSIGNQALYVETAMLCQWEFDTPLKELVNENTNKL